MKTLKKLISWAVKHPHHCMIIAAIIAAVVDNLALAFGLMSNCLLTHYVDTSSRQADALESIAESLSDDGGVKVLFEGDEAAEREVQP